MNITNLPASSSLRNALQLDREIFEKLYYLPSSEIMDVLSDHPEGSDTDIIGMTIIEYRAKKRLIDNIQEDRLRKT